MLEGVFFGLVAMTCIGVSDFVAAHASRRMSAIRTVMWVTGIELAVLLAIGLVFFRWPILTPPIALVIVAAGVLSAIAYLSYYKGLQVGVVSLVSPIAQVWSAVTVILSILFLNQSLPRFGIPAIALIIGGTMLAARAAGNGTRRGGHTNGVGYAVLTLFSWGIAFTLVNYLVIKLSWFFPLLFLNFVYVAFYLIYSTATRQNIRFAGKTTLVFVAIALLEAAGVLSYSNGINVGYIAVAPILAASPFITIMLAYAFFKERIMLAQKIGVAAIVTGLIMLAVV